MRTTTGFKAALGLSLLGGILLFAPGRALAINTLGDYQKSPAFVTSPVQPLTMLLLDNTGSMGFMAYSGTYDATKKYYGLFDTHTSGSSTADIYYYHPFNISGSSYVCNYEGISGTCNVPGGTAVGECTYPTRTCTTGGGGNKYTCYRADGTVTEFNNDKCDGPDSNTDSDCKSGESCDSHTRTVTTYTCRTTTNDVTSGTYTGDTCSGSCASGYSCVKAYACSSSGTTIYGEDKCDANNDGNTDCPSDNCTRKKNSSDTKMYTCAKAGGTSDSGSYSTSNCDNSCGTATCVVKSTTNVAYWTCKARGSATGDDYSNSYCDATAGGTTSDCVSGYSCVTAYQCTKTGSTTKYFPTSNCSTYRDITGSEIKCDTGNGWTCSATTSGTVEDWTGKTCATCTGSPKSGVCTDTGSKTDSSYDCFLNATNIAKCASYANSVCNPISGGTATCDWTDLEQKAVCQGLCGGTLIDVPTGSKQVPCASAADPTCASKYGSTCESGITYSTDRAPYWEKTPADATHSLGWNCNTGDCLGAGANVTLGNQLNFAQMTQMDVAKKVLIGGKQTTGIAGRLQLDGDYNSGSTAYYTCATGGGNYGSHKYCDNSDTHATKCANGSSCFSVTGGGNNGNILLQPGENPKGILQNNEGLAWGFGVFNAPDGGLIKKYIGSPVGTFTSGGIVQAINDTASNGSTPVAESLNTVVNYFRQVAPEYTTGEYTRDYIWDPFIDDATMSYAPCGRASTIVITDGEPNQDDKFNATIKNYANNNSAGITDFISPAAGTTNNYFVDDVAYWAHTNDLRTEAQMGGVQTMDTYFIYAFGNDAASKLKLQNAAVLGGFIDKNGDGKPNSKAVEHAASADAREWDFYVNPTTPGDDIPDNYAEASDGEVLADKLQNMLGQIQQKVSAGSAASVISASRSGEGAIYQAIFYPKTPPDADYRTITWVGDVHSLWLDDFGNMRMDCGPLDTDDNCNGADQTLNAKTDKIIEFYSDTTTGEAMVRIFRDTNGDSKYVSGRCTTTSGGTTLLPLAKNEYAAKEFDCTSAGGYWNPAGITGYPTDLISNITMKSLSHYLWSGGRQLAKITEANAMVQRAYNAYSAANPQRYIFTQKEDITGKPVPVAFTPAALQAAFGAAYKNYLDGASAVPSVAEADKVVNYIRGVDYPTDLNYRSRLYDWAWGDGALVNKLGDIVGSTPTIVAKPAEDYDVLYADKSYQRFRKLYDKRRVMVYAGGNDGGLHAFNGGYFDRSTKKFENSPSGKVDYALGSEMWMFVPKNLLPHLKWLTATNYGISTGSHVYYADLKPYVFDAKIFTPDAAHPDGWGTVLVGGMGFGGGDFYIDTNGDGVKDTYLRSSYFILDITDPESPPVVLGEYTDPNLGFSLAAPTAVPMLRCDRRAKSGTDVCPDNSDAAHTWPMDWYLAIGSGPHNDSATNPNGISTAIRGRSDQGAKMYLLKLGGIGSGALPAVSNGATILNVPALVAGGVYPMSIPVAAGSFPKSFYSDLIAVDYDLNFKTDVLYFGSISNTDKLAGAYYKGGMHRLVTVDPTTSKELLTPNDWKLNTFFNADKPVSAAPTVASDGSRAWVFFGTGRLLDAADDKSDTSPQSYFGLKERYKLESGKDVMDLTQTNGGNLVNVSNVWVENKTGNLYNIWTDATTGAVANATAVLKPTTGSNLTSTTFAQFNTEIGEKYASGASVGLDKYHGWKINFAYSKERNLGQAALLGSTLTFTTYIPSSDICTAEGESSIWATYYRTGTAYYKPILGLSLRAGKEESGRQTTRVRGMTLTPSLHSGAESGTKALIQTSTGAIISVDQATPASVKSGVISWRDKGAE